MLVWWLDLRFFVMPLGFRGSRVLLMLCLVYASPDRNLGVLGRGSRLSSVSDVECPCNGVPMHVVRSATALKSLGAERNPNGRARSR